MKRLYLFTLSPFLLFCLSSCIHLLGLDRYMNEEQEKQFEQFQKMGRLVIKNATSSTVYLVVDYTDYGNIPPGRRVSVSVAAGTHTLEAYDNNGQIKDRASIYLLESERYDWVIGGK